MNEKMILIDKDGKELECEIVALFNNPDFKSKYVAHTDGTKTGDKLNLLVSKYEVVDEQYKLMEITDEDEWKFVDRFIAEEVFGDDEF